MGPELEKRLCEVLAAEPAIRVAYVFGSQVAGRPRADSDLDLALVFDRSLKASTREDARRRVLLALSRALGPLGERADILDLDQAGSAIAFRVIRDGRRLLERDLAERVRLEAWIARRHDEEAPRRELFRRSARRAGARMGARTGG